MDLCLLDVLFVVVLFATLYVRSPLKNLRGNVAGLPFPPGPKGLPLLGNILDMPKSKPSHAVYEWRRKYGDVIYVQNLGRRLVFLNSYDAATELLEKRSSIYSDRPYSPMMRDLMGWHWSLPFIPYGDRFQNIRTLLHRFMQPAAVKNHHHIQALEAHRMIESLLESPKNFMHHVRRATGAVSMMVTYGHEVAPEGDLYIALADAALNSVSVAAVPGKYMVDTMHFLKYIPAWLPGAGFKRQAREWYKLSQAMLHIPFERTKEKILNGTAHPSMMSKILESKTDNNGRIHDEENIAACLAVTYAGGADTTVSTLLSFILALVLRPEIQARGQEELDRVIGKDRLPTFGDRQSLPYIEGIVKEALRWNPVLPLGIPHALMEDDVYNGYFIPAGSIIVPNLWGMLHDEEQYPNSRSFSPERWLVGNGNEAPRHPEKVAFGFGRRLCPGKHFADNSIYIGVVTILATLNISKAIDLNGNPIIPCGEYHPGAISQPKPFECSISPRSQQAVALIRHAIERSE